MANTERAFPRKGPSSLEVLGYVNGRLTTLNLTVADLRQMYHDISILMAELTGCFNPNDPVSPMSSQDRCTLRELLRRHPFDSNLPTLLDPPRSSVVSVPASL
jgi:hypothetical protein